MNEGAAARRREEREGGILLRAPGGEWPRAGRARVRLTPEQVLRLPEFAHRWTEIGLGAGPSDRPRAERAIRTMYRLSGLVPPHRILWCGSPLSVALARGLALGGLEGARPGRVPAPVLASLRAVAAEARGASPGAPVAARLGGAVLDRVAAAVADSADPAVLDRIARLVERTVAARVDGPLGSAVGEALEEVLGAPPGDLLRGPQEVGRLAGFDYLFAATPLRRETAALRGLWELARSASWCAPHERVCWVSERPRFLEEDVRDRLRGGRGPRIGWPDGWTVGGREGAAPPG
ncbi:MAG: hypothetical protein L6R43_04775 [Planctomycetes bacterium]|nr:hypothetical protein [Planctomycetota bacterium]